MSQDESLRLAATVVDGFSAPLKNLRSQMQGLSREGVAHNEALTKGFRGVEAGMKSAANAASSALTPALATVGITGLSLTATIAGIGAAMKNFGGAAKELGTLSRDTGVAASTLREVQGVLSAVGVDAGTSSAAIQKFAEEVRLAHRGFGPLMTFLRQQGRDQEGRAYFNQLADDIMRSRDAGDALMKALKGMEGIKDPIERRIYAENILKMADAARLADGRLGSLKDQIDRFRRNNGVISDKDIADAEAYARAMDGLKGTVNKLYDAVARELTPGLTEAAKALKGFMDNERNGISSTLVTSIRDIQAELKKIDWAQAGKDSLAFLKESTALAGSLAGSLHTIAEAMKALRKDDIPGALRATTGGAGTVGRLVNKFYPREQNATPLSEQLDAQMRGESMTSDQLRENQNLRANAPRVAEIEARQAEIARRLQQFDLMEKGGTTGDRSREAAEGLRREMGRLTDELRRIREAGAAVSGSGGATVQQQSYTGLGGLIHSASLGGGGVGRVRQMLNGGGGIVLPGGGAGGGIDLGDGFRGTPFGGAIPGGGAGRAGRALRGGQGDGLYGTDGASGGGAAQAGRALRGEGKAARGNLAANQQEAYAAARAEGLSDTAARALVANMSGESLRNPRDHHWDRSYMSQGIVQWDPQRAERIRQKFGAYPKDMSVTDQTRAAIWEMKTRPEYAPTWRALQGEHPGQMLDALVRNYERPQLKEKAIAERSAFYRGFTPREGRPDIADAQANGVPQILKPKSMASDPSVPGVVLIGSDGLRQVKPWPRADKADGSGFAAAFKRRQQDEEARREGFRLSDGAQGALRAGAGGGAKVEVNGSMTTVIRTRDPGTQVSHSASGNLFREIVQSRGRQMSAARDDG